MAEGGNMDEVIRYRKGGSSIIQLGEHPDWMLRLNSGFRIEVEEDDEEDQLMDEFEITLRVFEGEDEDILDLDDAYISSAAVFEGREVDEASFVLGLQERGWDPREDLVRQEIAEHIIAANTTVDLLPDPECTDGTSLMIRLTYHPVGEDPLVFRALIDVNDDVIIFERRSSRPEPPAEGQLSLFGGRE
jgi:hypothetical protein